MAGGSLTYGDCLKAHIPDVFRDLYRTEEDFGRVRTSALQTILRVLGVRRDLFVYTAGLLSTFGWLEDQFGAG